MGRVIVRYDVTTTKEKEFAVPDRLLKELKAFDEEFAENREKTNDAYDWKDFFDRRNVILDEIEKYLDYEGIRENENVDYVDFLEVTDDEDGYSIISW